MRVIQRIGRLAGLEVDLPPIEAKAAVAAGRADPIPGEEWRYEIAVQRQKETAELSTYETAMFRQVETRNGGTRICPHCGTQGRGGVMERWHFDNCKKRKQ